MNDCGDRNQNEGSLNERVVPEGPVGANRAQHEQDRDGDYEGYLGHRLRFSSARLWASLSTSSRNHTRVALSLATGGGITPVLT
jgi:hypothetical protein